MPETNPHTYPGDAAFERFASAAEGVAHAEADVAAAKARLLAANRVATTALGTLLREYDDLSAAEVLDNLSPVALQHLLLPFSGTILAASAKLQEITVAQNDPDPPRRFAYREGILYPLDTQKEPRLHITRAPDGPLSITLLAWEIGSESKNPEVRIEPDTTTDPKKILELLQQEANNDPPWERARYLAESLRLMGDEENANTTHLGSITKAYSYAVEATGPRPRLENNLGHALIFLNYAMQDRERFDLLLERWRGKICADESYPERMHKHTIEFSVIGRYLLGKDAWHEMTRAQKATAVENVRLNILDNSILSCDPAGD